MKHSFFVHTFPQSLSGLLPDFRLLIEKHKRSLFLSAAGWLVAVGYILYDYATYESLLFTHLVSPPHLYEMFFHVFMVFVCPVLFMFVGYQDCRKTSYLLELEEITAKWKKTFDSIPDLIFVLDQEHRVIDANRATLERFGKDTLGSRFCYAALGKNCISHDICPHNRCISGNETIQEEIANGAAYELTCSPVISNSGKVIGSVHIMKDISGRRMAETERKHLEDQLQQAQKMESIGRFAGGIAHDFNNVITAIRGYADMLLIKTGDDDLLRKYAEGVLSASEQATRLTSAILSFAGRRTLDIRPVDINQTMGRMILVIEGVLGLKIRLHYRLSDVPLHVSADEGQLEQVLINLAANARDAMPYGGTVTVGTRLVRGADIHPPESAAEGGDFAEISFSDTGEGMNEEVQKRIFEPFFTTKERGRGTGLGLAICYSIARQHGGFIDLSSREGHGTTFRIYLPVIPRCS